jgi:hypothetical protein
LLNCAVYVLFIRTVLILGELPPNPSLNPTVPIGARKQRRFGLAGDLARRGIFANPARRVSSLLLDGLLLEATVCASEVKHSRSLSLPRCPGRFATVEKGLKKSYA